MERVSRIIAELTKGDVQVIDRDSKSHRLNINDIMINAPYNEQVASLSRALPDVRLGTVDKFQGQEAPEVIFSMSTSSPEDTPRGMEFIVSK